MTLGFTDPRFCGGFESVLSIDNDRAAVETHSRNFSGKSVFSEIENWLKANKVPKADVVIGGPPCQGFSLLNKNRAGDDRRALWEPFLDVVELSGARVFVMENVAELYTSDEFQAISRRARKMGFRIVADVLNTANYGVAQTRRRTIAIGYKTKLAPAFPPVATHSKEKWRTVKQVIGDLPPSPIGKEVNDLPILNLHFGRSPTAKSLQRYAAVPPGGNRFDLQRNAPGITPNCWIRKKSGGTDLFGRLWWDRPSVTIRTEFFKPEKGRYLHPVENRPITHREAARIMGFPDTFEFVGSKIEIARQIGNAVPPPFAGAIAKSVRDLLSVSSKRTSASVLQTKVAKALPEPARRKAAR